MHNPTDLLDAPPSDATLWRYMDFTKLLSLLEKQALFFVRADKLGDPFEGCFPKAVLEKLKLGLEFRGQGNIYWNMTQALKTIRSWTLISCWHESTTESAAMWNCYNSNNDGIAIKTSYSRLCKSLMGLEDVYIGRVQYIDYDAPEPKGIFDAEDPLWNPDRPDHPLNLRSQFFKKRDAFRHEHEVRAVLPKSLQGLFSQGMTVELPVPTWRSGEYVKVDVAILIDSIVLSPFATNAFRELVPAVVARYNDDLAVRESSIREVAEWS